ncbi:MAG: hypothetical protein IJ343_10625 [Clostridia bacterium]|nr:hypothetical protein [Clostridia bacterium]
MKKMLVFLLLMLLCATAALAETELDGMSNAELTQLIHEAHNQLMLNAETDKNKTIYDEDGVRITLGETKLYDEPNYFRTYLTVINGSEQDVKLYFYPFTVNGWKLDDDFFINNQSFNRGPTLEAGQRDKSNWMAFRDLDTLADVTAYSDIETIQADLDISKKVDGSWKTQAKLRVNFVLSVEDGCLYVASVEQR